ncbi:MAG: lipid A phosphoethanolamine transferase [Paludibacteraceae bacterium]|nr:lipid A phosphoethanolamine transferase [Paludibacteraceae bacterium]
MRASLKYLIWVLCASLWATLCFVLPDFLDNPVGDWKALLSVLIYILSVGIFQFFIICLIGANKYICATLLPIYALLGSVCSYYRVFYHVSITPLLLDAALHTHIREAAGVVSIWLIVWIVCNLCIAITFCTLRWRKIVHSLQWFYWLIIILGMVIYYMAVPRLKQALKIRYPLNIIHSVKEYVSDLNRPSVMRVSPYIVNSDIPDSIIVVAVIGEATRADHMQLNGYPRSTNPKLSVRQNITSLSNIYSQYTNTNASVPHIFTRADSINTEYAYTEHSFVDLLKNAGFYTAWLSNKNQVKPYIDIMEEADTIVYTSGARTQSLYAKWLDGELLPLMDTFNKKSSRQLYVLHTMGSHWLYDTHVSDDLCVFQPTVSNRDIRQNSIEQIVNSYDNTIVYLDAFLDSVITKIEHYPAILLYLSDHGESLGEGGRFLHAQDNAPEEQYPAALVWYSDKYKALFPEKIEALHKNSQRYYRTDYYFYSILYAAGIEVDGDNTAVNIFK